MLGHIYWCEVIKIANNAASYELLTNKLGDINTQIVEINNGLSAIEQNIAVSDVTTIMSNTPELQGVGVSVIQISNLYNFWGTGAVQGQQTVTPGAVYYFITSDQFPPLKNYQGTATVGTLFIMSGGTAVYNTAVYFDGTGIYFKPSTAYTTITNGSNLSFTMLLILASSAPSP